MSLTSHHMSVSSFKFTDASSQQEQLREEPCFSFKKQPIVSKNCHSAISSFIEPDHHFNKSPESKKSVSTTSPKRLSTTDEVAQLDYDEQIRAPRMSTLSKTNSIARILEHEPLGDCDYMHRNSDGSTLSNDEFSHSSRNTSATSNNSIGLPALLTQQNTTLVEQTKHYCPATYDLNQPLRRYSTPSVSHTNPLLNKNHQQTYAEIAKKALHNLQHNMTSSEARKGKDPRERIHMDGPIRQIDELKTPNYLPAVLRPPNYQSSHSGYNTRKQSFSSLGENATSDGFNSRSSSPTGSRKPRSASSSFKFMDLPRDHWVANNDRQLCRMCHSKFSIINRKHHCRKCGEIFCMNCCYIRASLNYKLQFDLVNGILEKVCNGCAIDYNQYIRLNFANSRDGGLRSGEAADKRQVNELLDKERQLSVVPVDWNWSSF